MVLQMGGKTSAASKNKWNEKTYDRINLVVRKGQKEQIQEYAKEKGMSLNAYINALIQADMGEHLTPGVVKNLEGDADPVEWDRDSISPDRIESSSRRPLSFTEMWSAGAFLAQKITWPMQKSTNQVVRCIDG